MGIPSDHMKSGRMEVLVRYRHISDITGMNRTSRCIQEAAGKAQQWGKRRMKGPKKGSEVAQRGRNGVTGGPRMSKEIVMPEQHGANTGDATDLPEGYRMTELGPSAGGEGH